MIIINDENTFIYLESNWEDINIIQRYRDSCIPAGIEWLMEFHNISHPSLSTLQKKFQNGTCFGEIKEYLLEIIPRIRIEIFSDNLSADTRFNKIKELIVKNIPCLFSLVIPKIQKCHIMPVIGVSSESIKTKDYTLCLNDKIIKETKIEEYSFDYLRTLHEKYRRIGNDILWINQISNYSEKEAL